MEPPMEKDARWHELFKLNQDLGNDVVVLDAETGQRLPGGFSGTATQALFGVPGDQEEGDIPQQSLMLKVVPQGDLDEENAIPMQIRLVKPSDAMYLLLSIAQGLMCDELYEQIFKLIEQHECQEE